MNIIYYLGVVLGVFYDLDTWTWWLGNDRVARIVWELDEILLAGRGRNDLMLPINGELA